MPVWVTGWVTDGQRVTNSDCWQLWHVVVTAGVHGGLSTSSRTVTLCRCSSNVTLLRRRRHHSSPSTPNTPRKINDSCISEMTLSLHKHSQGNSVLKHRPGWCNFMLVHLFCGWVCSSPVELIYPEVVTAEEKLVPPYWIMMACENMAPGLSDMTLCFVLCLLFVNFDGCCCSSVFVLQVLCEKPKCRDAGKEIRSLAPENLT